MWGAFTGIIKCCFNPENKDSSNKFKDDKEFNLDNLEEKVIII
jgi:hypothetical protein